MGPKYMKVTPKNPLKKSCIFYTIFDAPRAPGASKMRSGGPPGALKMMPGAPPGALGLPR